MITLEKFKEIIETVKKFDEDNEQLTKILLKETYGFVDYYFPMEKAINELMLDVFDCDDPDIFSWWLWEKVEKTIEWKNVKYDLTNIEDLYYWLTKQYDKVKKI